MRLLEYEAKELFAKFGIPVPKAYILPKNATEEDWNTIKENYKFPAIVKGQIQLGKRKKRGLIKFIDSYENCRTFYNELMAKQIDSYQIEAVTVGQDLVVQEDGTEKPFSILHEYYCGLTLDPAKKSFVFIVSASGGIDIEEVAAENPDAIVKYYIEGYEFTKENAEELAKKVTSDSEDAKQLVDIFQKLWTVTIETEAQLTEINPLTKTDIGFIALDGKMMVDENAAFRRPFMEPKLDQKLDQQEKQARKFGFSYVPLKGEVGILANGAGLTLALIDLLSEKKLQPANFLDVGGGASKDRISEAFKLLASLKPKSILVNIYGGITRCDVVANGILAALEELTDMPPLVIRLIGTKDEEGKKILEEHGIASYKDLGPAVEEIAKHLGVNL